MKGWKKTVLSYLLRRDPYAERSNAWQPVIESKPLLSSQITPLGCSLVRDVPDEDGWVSLELYFEIEFNWDLRLKRGS